MAFSVQGRDASYALTPLRLLAAMTLGARAE